MRLPVATFTALVAFLAAAPAQASTDEADPFFGVVSQRVLADDDYDTMRWGRLGSFRLPIDWGTVESRGDGEMDWGPVDAVVEATARRGIDFMPTLYGSPRRFNENWRTLPVKNDFQVKRWQRFLTAAAFRYGSDGEFWVEHPGIEYRPVEKWQIWNEPNIYSFAKPVSVRNYARLLRASSRALASADPDGEIVLAGLYGNPSKGKGIDAGPFLNRLYRFPETRSSFDIAAVHPYATTGRVALERTMPVRRVMDRHGNRNRPLMITELGWGSDDTSAFGMGSARGQADVLRSAYRTFLSHRKRLHLEAIYWFSWSDVPLETKVCVFCQATGFFDVQNEPKPAWFELLNFSHDL